MNLHPLKSAFIVFINVSIGVNLCTVFNDWFRFTIINVHDISSNKVNDLVKYNKHYFGLMYLYVYIFAMKYYTYEINGYTTTILSLQWKFLNCEKYV